MMYKSRYYNMHKVCHALSKIESGTATDISKHINLSRQSINKILKDCRLYGYVTSKQVQHRSNSVKNIWTITEHWKVNSTVYVAMYKLNDKVSDIGKTKDMFS